MRRFYSEVLGLRAGARPAFPFGGAWMYCGERAVVHFIEVDAPPSADENLHLEHFAFSAHDLKTFLEQLNGASVEYQLAFIRDFKICQVNLVDPDGNHLHVDFHEDEARALQLL